MRLVVLITFLLFSFGAGAQTLLPLTYADYSQRSAISSIHANDTTAQKKWFFSKYAGLSTSFSFFKGGNATVVAAPVGLQINRQLNNNLFAFAGVSVAPAYINFNQRFLTQAGDKNFQQSSFLKANSLGIYSRAEVGLMYVNDARTFSISGSIGVERGSYPMMMPYQNNGAIAPRNPAIFQ
ncbi:hypothetical protein I5907_11260 [Panacibacter sp. DH6]|uniref:Type IX secretion system membrane protein PorP/SprF n=1 Tax=Panacibacter microcysteis TaxID=2793269 RepID=A0A931E4C3_9BACT|nr:hypothetical protein [Panacibacter microcysteis]MBG9376818.1 hypothetical protein [Panacibacter microcysteis]